MASAGTRAQPGGVATPLVPRPIVAPAAATESSEPPAGTRLDQIKTVLAVIGGFLLLFHALRLIRSLGDK